MSFHFCHKFKPVSVEHSLRLIFPDGQYTQVGLDAIEKGFGTKVTRILYRCECGKVKSAAIDGKWTLEQITSR